ncbi:MAG: HIT domain-containing protein [Gammaproteobacteria bacterium]|nr:MAG: HIT domain-containing protein [Gammaproteobacteria bacterium]
MATIHTILLADCIVIGHATLSHLLLSNDARYPWCILVPDRDGISEIHELNNEDQVLLLKEITQLSRAMMQAFDADKMNIAALGNVVPQLHVHCIARYKNDPAWPDPVWGKFPAKSYSETGREQVLSTLKAALGASYQWL